MTAQQKYRSTPTLVAIDVAKTWNVVLVEKPDGKQQRFRVANTRNDHNRLVSFLKNQPGLCRVALEPTGDYHRPLAKFNQQFVEQFGYRFVHEFTAIVYSE